MTVSSSRQANEQFLIDLIERYGDKVAKREYFSVDYINYLKNIESQIHDSPQRDWAMRAHDKILSGVYYFDNPLVQDVLVPVASRHLGSDFSLVESIPVGFLPSRIINGFEACGPNGECAIVLDDPILAYSICLFRAYFGYALWYFSSPYSWNLFQEDYGRALVALAFYNVTRKDEYRKKVLPIMSAIAKQEPAFENEEDCASFRVLMFILLHEYGHIVKGHLDPSNTSLWSFPENMSIRVFDRNQSQEFEADILASLWMLSLDPSIEHRRSFLLTTGVLFRFMDLCERFRSQSSDTHPPAIDRWCRIKSDPQIIGGVETPIIKELDNHFDELVDGLGKAGVFK